MDRRTLLLGLAATPLLARSALAANGEPARTIIGRWADANRFAGVVSLGRNGLVVENHPFGPASIEDGTLATPATRYAMGSVSKWFATTAALRLGDRGVIRLDAPIGRYLSSIRGDAATKVQVVHLLSNASGIPDGIVEALKTDPTLRTSTASAAEIVARYVRRSSSSNPERSSTTRSRTG